MSNVKEYRDQSQEELKALYQDLSKELFQLRNEMKVTRKMEKPHLVRIKKKDRARVMTILREKELKATS
ncbi:MAG: 50S ribosomal protein L29 [Verrucomicrobia bacterium]|nr:50S ribosomal protein L29 [Verrucomicrobiota bacterium]